MKAYLLFALALFKCRGAQRREMTNCLFFARALYKRRRAKGKRSYWSARPSDSGNFPHFLYGEWRFNRMRVVSYKPNSPIDRKCPPVFFEGRVRWGDPAPQKRK